MNANPSLGRRQFLQATTAAGAVFALGLDSLGNVAFAAEQSMASFGPKLFDTWLRISPDNVITLVSGEAEFGQGATTGLATLVAEELDAEMSQMRILQSDASFVYANPGTHSVSTNSSASIRNRYDQMRNIGATAREMFKQAAANMWKVPASELTTAKAMVNHAKSNRSATYGSLTMAAMNLPIPQNVPMKSPDEWKLIGSPSVARMDIVDKCTGHTTFGVDVRVPGMVHAAIIHSPVLGGKVASVDDSKAMTRKGVKKVVNMGFGVAVVADDEWTARNAALQDLKITWDEGPNAKTSSADIAKQFEDAVQNRAGGIAKKVGDVDAVAKAPGNKVIEVEYILPYLYHATMEPHNSCAYCHDGIAELWTPTAHSTNVTRAAGYILGTPPNKVKLTRTAYEGGSFGRRGRSDPDVEAMLLTKELGVPVHVLRSREEDVQHEWARPYSRTKFRGVIDGQGNLLGWYQKISSQDINACFLDEVSTLGGVPYERVRADNIKIMGRFMEMPYDFFAANASPNVPPYNTLPNIHVETVKMESPQDVTHWRSVGKSGGIWTEEAFVDEMAEMAKMDPIEFRRKIFANNPRYLAVLDRLVKEANWPQKSGNGTGWGVAFTDMGYGAMGAVAVQVAVNGKKLQIQRVICVSDLGVVVNPDLTHAQVQGGVVDGLQTSMYGEMTIKDGRVQQSNFGDYRLFTLRETPPIESILIESRERPGSISEMWTPLVIPGLTNAIYAATGKRIRELPIKNAGYSI